MRFNAKVKPRLNNSTSDFNNFIPLSPLKIAISIPYTIILAQLASFYIFTISTINSHSDLCFNNTLFLYFGIMIIITYSPMRDLSIVTIIGSINSLISNF